MLKYSETDIDRIVGQNHIKDFQKLMKDISLNAPPNKKNKIHSIILVYIARYLRINMVDIYVRCGGNLDEILSYQPTVYCGCTLLNSLVIMYELFGTNRRKELVSELLKYGASTNIKNKYDINVEDHIKYNRESEVSKIIREFHWSRQRLFLIVYLKEDMIRCPMKLLPIEIMEYILEYLFYKKNLKIFYLITKCKEI